MVPIPFSALSIVAEKFARACEYKLMAKYVEPPYGLRTFISHPDEMRAEYGGEQRFELGPGFKVKYVRNPESTQEAVFWFLLWDSLCFKVFIALEAALIQLEPTFSRPKGLTRDDMVEKRNFREST